MSIEEEVLEEWIADYYEWVDEHRPICIKCIFHKEVEDEHFCTELDLIRSIAGSEADESKWIYNLCMMHNAEGYCQRYEPKERI